jgi:hypothetical protein
MLVVVVETRSSVLPRVCRVKDKQPNRFGQPFEPATTHARHPA